jgi:hypothetical protein
LNAPTARRSTTRTYEVVGVHRLQPQSARPRQHRERATQDALRHERAQEQPADLCARTGLERQRGPQPCDGRAAARLVLVEQPLLRRLVAAVRRGVDPGGGPTLVTRHVVVDGRVGPDGRRRDDVPDSRPPGRLEHRGRAADVRRAQSQTVVARLDGPREVHHRVGAAHRPRELRGRVRTRHVA